MRNLIAGLRTHSRAAGILALLLLAPWVWAIFLIPWWISGIAFVVTMLGSVVAVWFVFGRSVATEDPTPESDQLADQNRAVRSASRPLRRLLSRWAGITQTSSSDLAKTQRALEEVIEQSETAVLEISKNFRNITSRSSQQIAYALGLLQTTQGPGEVGSGDNVAEEMSLPEYIRAYEVLLNFGLDRLSDFARDCLRLVEQAEAAGLDSQESKRFSERVRRLAEENKVDAEQLRADALHLSGGMTVRNQQVTDVLKHINATALEIKRDVDQLVMAMQFQDITQQKLERVSGQLLNEIIKSLSSITDETRVLSKQLKTGAIPMPGVPLPDIQAAVSLEPDLGQQPQEPAETRTAAGKDSKSKNGKARADGSEDSSVELF